ncbi:MAG: SMC family ATPase [Microthrixaceae bacterium]|nr:SMC family ATPase [Microthrixaceae bacterium]
MRPHHLSITAFGAFAEPQEIDFDRLAEEGLFLIHGRTGAGKTTLLDAIVFALFGVTSNQAPDKFVSHHVDIGTQPTVELEFSIGTNRYRVTRSPGYQARARKQGTFTSKSSTAALIKIDQGKEVPVASGVREVSHEIGELIGLSADQFTQVMLLPQGRFEQVLKSKSDDRQTLLERLFDTSLYAAAQQWLFDSASEARVKANETTVELDRLVADAADRCSTLTEAAPTLQLVSRQENEDPSKWMDLMVDLVASEAKSANAATKAAEAASKQASEVLSKAEALAQLWHRRNQTRKRLEELEGQAPEIDRLRGDLEKVDAALALKPLVSGAAGADHALATATTDLGSHMDALRKATSLVAAVDPTFPASAPTFEGITRLDDDLVDVIRQRSKNARDRVNTLKSMATNLATVQARCSELQSAVERDKKLANQNRETVEKLEAAIAAIAAEIETHRSNLGDPESIRGTRDATAERLKAAKQAKDLASMAEVKREEHQNLVDDHQNARDTAQELRSRYLDGIAAELAASLIDGESCPVCGSNEHPMAATPADDAVTRAEAEAADKKAQAADKQRSAAAGELSALEVSLAAATASAGAGSTVESLTAELADLDLALSAATKAAEAVKTLSATHEEQTQQLSEARERLVSAQSALAGANAELATVQAQATELEQDVAKLSADGLGPDDLDGTESCLDQLDVAFQNAQSSTAKFDQAKKAADSERQSLKTAIASSRFRDIEEVTVVLDSYTAGGEDRDDWLRRITSHDDELRSSKKWLNSDEATALPEDEPMVTDAKDAAEAASTMLTTAIKYSTMIDLGLEDLTETRDTHRDLMDHSGEITARAAMLSRVADRVGGKTKPRISLQRWVLRSYLEEICEFANSRLTKMTSGRYCLEVRTTESKGNAQAGLDLNVFDAHTGQSRDVATLSGGETFQASLSLALGVADTVSAHHGGIRLEALFVDEGFGSLDQDSLQLAMDELDALREGGRMVGLISHVPALRERIGFGVEVTATPHGSTARIGEVAPI